MMQPFTGYCVRGHHFPYKLALMQFCIDCCIMLCCLHLHGDDGGCSCMLLLMTFAPCVLTFASYACGVSTGAKFNLHIWWYHSLQHPATGASPALAPVLIVLCGGGVWW